jgi:hypothetical protein
MEGVPEAGVDALAWAQTSRWVRQRLTSIRRVHGHPIAEDPPIDPVSRGLGLREGTGPGPRTACRYSHSMNFDVPSSIDILRRTPAVVRTLLTGADDAWTRSNEGPETFSPFDVVGHLIDGEETDWVQRALIILGAGPNRRFEPYDRFRHQGRNTNRSLDSLLEEFAKLRSANLDILQSWRLTAEHLDQKGEHPTLGPVTLRQVLAAWVVHDLGHIAQIARVMAKQYGGEVGPWGQFLPVLTDHPTPRS